MQPLSLDCAAGLVGATRLPKEAARGYKESRLPYKAARGYKESRLPYKAARGYKETRLPYKAARGYKEIQAERGGCPARAWPIVDRDTPR